MAHDSARESTGTDTQPVLGLEGEHSQRQGHLGASRKNLSQAMRGERGGERRGEEPLTKRLIRRAKGRQKEDGKQNVWII